jgi:Tfp pilus assembly protein FimV
MKKLGLFLMIVCLAGVLSISCKSAPAQTEDSTPKTADPAKPLSQSDINAEFKDTYEKYASKLILDGAKSYTVVSGDNLSNIASANFGADNGYYFPVIMLASSDVTIQDPDLIQPGIQLTIPDLDKNLDDADAKANIKAFLQDVSDIYGKKKDGAGVQARIKQLADSL